MNSLIVLFVATLALAQGSIIGLGQTATLVGPANPGALLQGPASSAAVIGPDGSIIQAAAQAGALAAAPIAGGVVSGSVAPGIVAPGLIAPGLIAAPGLLGAGLLGGHGLLVG